LQKHPVFSAFLSCSIIADVPKDAFLPEPGTDSVLISITHKIDDILEHEAFIRRKLFLQKDKKLKNALRETLIGLCRLKGQILTKNQARERIEKMEFSANDLEKEIDKFPPAIYADIAKKIENLNLLK
jgi:16S rRNA A1518/A1519 N6-dimethyltransferase RsmA/KsgA/DIM1 with predicted DNA glycosylase/AP lyase activity